MGDGCPLHAGRYYFLMPDVSAFHCRAVRPAASSAVRPRPSVRRPRASDTAIPPNFPIYLYHVVNLTPSRQHISAVVIRASCPSSTAMICFPLNLLHFLSDTISSDSTKCRSPLRGYVVAALTSSAILLLAADRQEPRRRAPSFVTLFRRFTQPRRAREPRKRKHSRARINLGATG